MLRGADRMKGFARTAGDISHSLRVRIPFLEQKGDNCGVGLDIRMGKQDSEARELPSTYSNLHSSSHSKQRAAFRELEQSQIVGKRLLRYRDTKTQRKSKRQDV